MNQTRYFSDNPQQQISDAFRRIEQNQMQGLPVCNEALTTELVGMRRFGDYWLGVLITPWTLQLLLLPASADAEVLEEGDHRSHAFPQGEVVFMASDNPDLGIYQSCALRSPLHDFPSQEVIRQTAGEVLDLLFQPPAEQPEGQSVKVAMPGRLDIEKESRPIQETRGSRRDFLRGRMR